MKKGMKIVLACFTAWPILYMALFMSFIFSTVFRDFSETNQGPPEAYFKILFGLHFFTMIEIMALIGFYIYYIFKTDRVPSDKKTLWAVVIFLGNMVSMPIFWFLYIWKTPKAPENTEQKAN